MRRGAACVLLAAMVGIGAAIAQSPSSPPHCAVEVVDEKGEAIAGAEVALAWPGGAPRPIGTTDARGRWSAAIETAAGEELVVSAPGRSGAVREVLTGSSVVALARGVTLAGRVRDVAGKRIAGAIVRVEPLRDSLLSFAEWRTECRAVSDQSGIFKLQGVPDNNVRLTVEVDGYLVASLAPIALGLPLEVVLQPSAHIRGVVVDAAGAPAAADLEVEYEGDARRQVGHTAADGTFSLTWQRPTFCRVYARTGSPPTAIAIGEVLQKPGADLRLLLRPLTEMPMLRVRATGDGGAPLTSIRAAVVWSADGSEEVLLAMLPSRDKPGGDVCCLWPPTAHMDNTGTVLVVAPGRAATTKPVTWSPGADGSTEVVVATEPESTLRGVVLDAAGKPVGGAAVWAQRPPLPRGSVESSPSGEAARTAADGSFVLHGLGRGRAFVHASLGAQRARPMRVEVAAGENDAVQVQLAATVSIRGRVVPSEPGWRLALVVPVPNPLQSVTGTLDFASHQLDVAEVGLAPDGGFAFADLRPGPYVPILRLPRPPHRGGWLEVELHAIRVEEPDEEFVLDAEEIGPGKVRVQVECKGASVPTERMAIEVRAIAREGAMPMILGDYGWAAVGAVGRNGTCEFATPPGRQRVRVVDVFTGITLGSAEPPVDITAGELVETKVHVDVAELQLEFVDVDAAGRRIGKSLRYSAAEAPPWAGMFGTSLRASLMDAWTSTSLYVPDGSLKLYVDETELPEPQAQPLSPRGIVDPLGFFAVANGAEIPITADVERPTKVKIEVPRRMLFR